MTWDFHEETKDIEGIKLMMMMTMRTMTMRWRTTTRMTTTLRTTTIIRVAQLWDMIETWGFLHLVIILLFVIMMKVDVLGVLLKTPCLYLVPELR